jgi:hypothetical protein
MEKLMNRLLLGLLVLCFSLAFLVACGQPGEVAAGVVEKYLTALVDKDQEALSQLTCADWEADALLDMDSLQAVETRLEGLTCTTIVAAESSWEVNCKGAIIATYNGEDQILDLSIRNYQVDKQGGEYLVCGYQ